MRLIPRRFRGRAGLRRLIPGVIVILILAVIGLTFSATKAGKSPFDVFHDTQAPTPAVVTETNDQAKEDADLIEKTSPYKAVEEVVLPTQSAEVTPLPTLTQSLEPTPAMTESIAATRTPSTRTTYKFSHLVNNGERDFPMKDECIDRIALNLSLLIPFGIDPASHKNETEYVLVLGSGGLVGQALVGRLKARGYNVLEVRSRHHHDLRLDGALDIFSGLNISFVFFLACEVGGAKFLTLPELQEQIKTYNMDISNNVFGWLERHNVRFCFASSSLSADNSNYGEIKRYGENRTHAVPHIGRVFKLWNAYGFEYPGPKSHAIPDFIFQCLAYGKVATLTNGEEKRQFTHVNDISDALIAIKEHFEETPIDVDVTDGNWLKLVDIARTVASRIDGCVLNVSAKPAKKQSRHEPNLTSLWHQRHWQQKIAMEDGIGEIVGRMKKYITECSEKAAVAFIIDCGPEINETVIQSIGHIVKEIDSMNSLLAPQKVEIIAASQKLVVDSDKLPCTTLINSGHYRRKAVKMTDSKAETVAILNWQALPTMQHMYFFQRRIPTDFMFYFGGASIADEMSEAHGETNATKATFALVNQCGQSYGKRRPKDLGFIVATKETWKSIKVPPSDVQVNDWLLQFAPGYVAVRFETPAWSWGGEFKRVRHQDQACCTGHVKTSSGKSGDSTIYHGLRPLSK